MLAVERIKAVGRALVAVPVKAGLIDPDPGSRMGSCPEELKALGTYPKTLARFKAM